MVTGYPGAVQRVGERHADLGHAVALQQYVRGDLVPAIQNRLGKGGRTGDHQPAGGKSEAGSRNSSGKE